MVGDKIFTAGIIINRQHFLCWWDSMKCYALDCVICTHFLNSTFTTLSTNLSCHETSPSHEIPVVENITARLRVLKKAQSELSLERVKELNHI